MLIFLSKITFNNIIKSKKHILKDHQKSYKRTRISVYLWIIFRKCFRIYLNRSRISFTDMVVSRTKPDQKREPKARNGGSKKNDRKIKRANIWCPTLLSETSCRYHDKLMDYNWPLFQDQTDFYGGSPHLVQINRLNINMK